MSNWTAITLDALNNTSVIGLVQAMRDEAAEQGLPDPWPVTTAQVTDELRDCIGFSGKFPLDIDPTKIPGGLLQLALKKVVREMSRSLGRSRTDDDKTDEATYERRLTDLRSGNWPIAPADNPVPAAQVVQNAVPSPVIRRPHRHFTPRHQEGY